MLTPDELLHISEGAEKLAEELHQDILARIIERILLRIGRGDDYILTAVDKWQIELLQDAGYLLEDIQKAITQQTPYLQTEIAEAMEDAGVRAITYDNAIYQAAGLSPLPLEQSPALIRIMQRNYEATLGELVNFTRTMAGTAQQAYIQACDKAYNQVLTGSLSYTQAVREAVMEMVSDGVKVTYPSGHTDTIETATLRAVRTGVSQATGQITEARMEEMDWDIVLTSAHLGARPGNGGPNGTNHIWWQGRFFSRSGESKQFPDFRESTGYGTVTGLCGANCRHSFGPGDGENNPYDTKDINFADQREAYEIQQRQRTLERRIRNTKREVMGLNTARQNAEGDLKDMLEADYQRKSALLQKQNKAYNDFCREHDLKKLNDRISIAQWDRKQAAQARAASKKWNNKPDDMARLPKKPIDNSSKDGTIKENGVNRVDFEEGRKVQRVIANRLRTEKENINLDGLPVQAQRYVLDATRKVTAEYPQLVGYTRKIVYSPSLDATAQSKSLRGILEIGPDFRDLEKLQKTHDYDIKLGYHPKGTNDISSIIIHEFGHQLDGYLTLKGVYGGSVSQYGVTRTSVAVQKEVLRRVGLSDERLREIRREYAAQGYSGEDLNHAVIWERGEFISDNLSEYAKRNSNEFFAECFMEYMSSASPRKVARAFGELLAEILEEL